MSNQLIPINLKQQFTIDSREVAEMIEKEHSNLMRDIRGYAEILDNSPDSKLNSAQFFIESTYLDKQKQERPCYQITRKGCDMVANKMTGEKGILFTATYVTKFEEMEKQVIQPLQIDSKFMYLLAAQLEEKEKQIAVLTPKAEYFDDMAERNHLTNFRDTAKELKVKESLFITILEAKGFLYRDSKGRIKPDSYYVPDLFEIKEFVSEKNGFAGNQTLITHKGREKFRKLFKEDALCQNK